jgi:hypothetical protein
MRRLAVTIFFVLAAAVRSVPLAAQTTERPSPFDSTRRVLAITPNLAERLRLDPSVWPVQGSYREARLYHVEADGFVLVVQRLDGAMDRFALTSAQRDALTAAVESAMATTGRPSGEAGSSVVSEPAGNAFARHQTLLAAAVYAPIAASLTDDPAVGGAVYLGLTGATFFASYGAAQTSQFTRAQSDLAADLGLAAAGGGWLLGYAVTGEEGKGVRAVSLLSGFWGTVAGATLGRTLSDAEVHSATLGIETGAMTAVAGAALVNLDRRTTSVLATAFGAGGYALGVGYPRRASYTVTAGDAEAMSTMGLLGALYGGVALSLIDRPSARTGAGILAPAYLAGVIAGDQLIARNYDLTQSQANILKIAGSAGALLGLVIPVLAGGESIGALAGASLGATIGIAGMVSTFPAPLDASTRVGSSRSDLPVRSASRLTLSVPSAVAAFGRRQGNHVIAQWRF